MRVALVAIFILALLHLLPFTGYLTDDTFIHLQFAKHLIAGRGFAFNAGEPTYGATSPLWVLLLAGVGSLVPGTAATPADLAAIPALAVVAKALGAVFVLAAVVLLVLMGRLLGWGPRLSLVPGLLLALHAWSARWAISGMETPLAVFLVSLALLGLARTLLTGRGAALTGAVLGLAALARPECWLLAVIAMAAIWTAGEERRRGRLLAAIGGLALTSGPWLAIAWSWFHQVLPNTSAAKAAGFGHLDLTLAALKTSGLVSLSSDAVLLAACALAIVGSGTTLLREMPRARRIFWLSIALWPVVLVLGLALGGVQVVSRYLLPALPSLLLLGAASAAAWIGTIASRHRVTGWALLLVLYAGQNTAVTLLTNAPHARRHTPGLLDSLGALGLWARTRTPPGTLFAVPDIGAFGFYSERPVLDLYGLVTPRMAPITVHAGYDAVVSNLLFEAVGRPAYLIDRARTARRLSLPADPANPYRPIGVRTIPDLGVTRPGEWVYTVYAIDWNLYDQTHQRVAGQPLEFQRARGYAESRLEAGYGPMGGRRQDPCASDEPCPDQVRLRASASRSRSSS